MIRSISAAVLLFATVAFADLSVKKVDDVHFLATGPGGLKINGQTSKLEAKKEGDAVVLRVPLDTVDTGIELRNSHMKEKYLDTRKFPYAELKIPAAMLKEGAGQKGTGTFTVHGQSKEVALSYDAVKSGDALDIKGNFDINLKNHGIEVPSYLGVTVKPEVKVVAAFSVAP